MPSCRSCSNLMDLVADPADDFPSSSLPPPRLPRVMALSPSAVPDPDGYPASPSPSSSERRIVVSNQLPIRARRDPDDPHGKNWLFSWDQDALVLQLKAGFPPGTDVIYVGTLRGAVDIDPADQEPITQRLYEEFRCVPVFLAADVYDRYYHGFCKHYLWPLFHYMVPLSPSVSGGGLFDGAAWRAYVCANIAFADRVMQVIDPDEDYVWLHDYHLLVLPTFLRKRVQRVKLGFFLHSPFPSSEIYRTLPVREEILRALLNADLVGFHTFDYARHFLSCCSRLLGLDYESKRGHIGLEYYGRTVTVKILPVGIDMGQMQSLMASQAAKDMIKELRERYRGKTVLLGVDDMDLFKGIGLKFMAMGQLLEERPALRGQVVLVQIANPARSTGDDIREVERETRSAADDINARYGCDDYQPIVFINRAVTTLEKAAYYAVSECVVVNAVRDGMNLVPYKYTVCRELVGGCISDGTDGKVGSSSVIVVSEFIGCSPSLSGAIRVNPWNVDAVASAMSSAISMPEAEKRMRHEKHYRYVSSHDVAYWAKSFDGDLQRACGAHYLKRCWGIGFGLGFRVVALDPAFRRLSVEHIACAYRRAGSRLVLLDYDGTVMPQGSSVVDKAPSAEVVSVLNTLCEDPKNVVFVVSGRGKVQLGEWFGGVAKLGISAEHGYLTRWSRDEDWQTSSTSVLLPSVAAAAIGGCTGGAGGDAFEWKSIVEPVMKQYMDATDGSSIEYKESALVWHHSDADPDFGSCQAKELLDHLENVLANEPVVVKRGQHIVEVKPQGVSKGVVVEKLISIMHTQRGSPPEFVLCVGDDRSDEDMFEAISNARRDRDPSAPAMRDVFACTVGKKPSKARYYLDDTVDVVRMLRGLANLSSAAQQQQQQQQYQQLQAIKPSAARPLVSFEG